MARPIVDIAGLQISARWLRDHGDDPASVHPETGQRVVDTFAIPRDVAAVSVAEADGVAEIHWTDGATTTHTLDALTRVAANPRHPSPSRGSGSGTRTFSPSGKVRVPDPTRTFPAAVIGDDAAWGDALGHLRDHGWVAFEGASPGPGPVEALAGRIGYVRRTLFGDVWEMKAGADEHKDSAYDPVALDVHTDGTYSNDAPGTIVFSQQAKDGTGGDSVLVDGFAVARDLFAADPEAADLLTRYEIRGRYLEPGVAVHADRVPIRLDADGALRQISFNNYDRAAVLPAEAHVDAVLDAYAAFRSMANDPARALRLEWEPGRMLVVDNWRMLHGRTDYTGQREFLGCYTNHEDLEGAYELAGFTPGA